MKTPKDMAQSAKKFFGSWAGVISFGVVMGLYTALVAMWVPDGNSFHDIAVTPEWWVLPAILIIISCEKPLEAALKTFVFFLVSQPLVYLFQVPFNGMGWGLFRYYTYWFMVTLLTFPGAYLGWFIKKDKWYSGVILAVMTSFLAVMGFYYVQGFQESFPNHLISTIYCFAMVPILIFGIFKKWLPRIITGVISIGVLVATILITGLKEPYVVYNNSFAEFVGVPEVTGYAGTEEGEVEIIKYDGGEYTFKLTGLKGAEYTFTVNDETGGHRFKYHFDKDSQTVVVERDEDRFTP